jgi:hypothetical protein
MKKYSVYYNNNVECNKVAEFATLDEAKTIVQRTQRAATRFAQATTVMKVAATISVTRCTKEIAILFLTRMATLRSSRIPFMKQNSFIVINRPIII